MRHERVFYKMFLKYTPRDWWGIFNSNLLWNAVTGIQDARRLGLNLTQKQLADRVGTTQSGIARFESGRFNPTLKYLRKLANAMGYVVVLDILPLREAIRKDMEDLRRRAYPINEYQIDFSSQDTATSYFNFPLLSTHN